MRPEIDLLINCFRVNIDAVAKERIRDFLEYELDWTFLVETALHHQVVPLLRRGLMQAAETAVPDDIANALQIFCDRRESRNQAMLNELLCIANALKQHSIDILAFKGPALALQAYHDSSLRVFNDLDFLIHEQDYIAVLDVLHGLGYVNESWKTPVNRTASWRYYGQDILFDNNKHMAIEPHWLFTPRPFTININYDALWQRATSVSIDNHTIGTLSPDDHLLILCVHGCKEQWIYLKQICDVAALVDSHTELDWKSLCRRAEEQGCLRMLLIGLGLTKSIMGINLSPVIDEKLMKDKTAISLIEQGRLWLLNQQRTIPDINKINLFRLRMRDTWRDRFIYALRTWLMPSDKHFRIITLPASLFWLYVPIKLVHDYLLLPLWLLAKHAKRSADSNGIHSS